MEFDLELEDFLETILDDCKNILKNTIENNVYNYYSPVKYKRTKQLLDSWIIERRNNSVYILFNGNGYYSVVGDKPLISADQLINFTDLGHSDGKSFGQYHNYEARNYLEDAKKEIERKYGLKVNVEVVRGIRRK